jgi:excinuclease ABC subunit A
LLIYHSRGITVRDSITIQGAKEHNLKNITVAIPRNQLVVITGVSGSGKSTLAFDTVYAEGQRRYLESMDTFAKRFIAQLKRPNVDFVTGLSPVISIEQKTTIRNPRSTVGTMTDIYDYLRMLYATIGIPHCPYCGREVPVRSAKQMLEWVRQLPHGAEIEIRAPVLKFYGEDWAFLFDDVRAKGYRRVYIDGRLVDTSQELTLDEDEPYRVDVLVDHFNVHPGMDRQILASLEHGLMVGEGFVSLHIVAEGDYPTIAKTQLPGCPEHGVLMGEQEAHYFSFNLPSGSSSCVTCTGLGTYRRVHPDLLVLDKSKGIRSGAFAKEALNYDKNNWTGRMVYSLAHYYGFNLDTPFADLPPEVVDILFYGTKGEKFTIILPEGATVGAQHVGREMRFGGIISHIERSYRRYRKEGTYNHWMEEWLKKVMVEHTCPDCGGKRLKPQRFQVTVGGKTIHELGEMSFEALIAFLEQVPIPEKKIKAGTQVVHEIVRRLRLLLDIGLDYLTLNRPSNTLSGGESQRIRLSTQIGSDLMGMLYVLDEPTIGLHPYDSRKMVTTLRRLRDLGNSVIVVEHDEAIIRAADHIIEMGPGPGEHGGEVVAAGGLDVIRRNPASLTGQYLEGVCCIPLPGHRRSPNGKNLVVRGAQENNLQDIDVILPLGVFTCITGVSGSGKSSLIHEILYKRLVQALYDSRVLPGRHRSLEGVEHISDVIHIDQSPIGRSSRSNPATYIGVYDTIRALFAGTPEAQERGYTVTRFSFNAREGRCEECQGEGVLWTHLQYMADVETVCPVCKGGHYNAETLEIKYLGKSIADVLDMSLEESRSFFSGPGGVSTGSGSRAIHHKLRIMNELGLGYLKLGHPAPKLSGGEAQRIKLAHELGKIKRGRHNLYILDEPTTGLHAADIQKLLDSLNRLVDAGHTVVVIEHHLDVIKTADWVIDLGPDGGQSGGRLVAQGTPEQVAQVEGSYTGQYLKTVIAR